MKKLLLLANVLFFTTPTLSSEQNLLELAKKSPHYQEIELSLEQSKLAVSSTEEKYSLSGFGSINYSENYAPGASFSPTFSPTKNFKLGVRQRTTHGLQYTLSTGLNITNAGSVGLKRYTSISTELLAELDLWKNRLGKEERSNRTLKSLEKENQLLHSKIKKTSFLISLRKVYWSYLANEQALEFSKKLLETAKRQLKLVKDRERDSLAEADEVARYASQVAERSSRISALEYQSDRLKNQILEIAPSYRLQKVKIENVIETIRLCAQKIGVSHKTPYELSFWNSSFDLLDQISHLEKELAKSTDSPELKLVAGLSFHGVDGLSSPPGKISDAASDWGYDRRSYNVGLNLNIPLSSEKRTTRQIKEKIAKLRARSAKEKLKSRLNFTHKRTLQAIPKLFEVIEQERRNSAYLKKSTKILEKKYRQARASATEVINNQDSLLSSELSSIETRLNVINILLDYFDTFQNFNCTFNYSQKL